MSQPVAIHPVSGALGAEISGVDLSKELSDDTLAAIRRAPGSSTSSSSSATRSCRLHAFSPSPGASASRSSTRS